MKFTKFLFFLSLVLVSATSKGADVTIQCSTNSSETVPSTLNLSGFISVYSVSAQAYATTANGTSIINLGVSASGQIYYAQYNTTLDGTYFIKWTYSGRNLLGTPISTTAYSPYYYISFVPKSGWLETSTAGYYTSLNSALALQASGTNRTIWMIHKDDGGGTNAGVIQNTYSFDSGNTWSNSWFPSFPRALSGTGIVYNNSNSDVYYVGSDAKIYKITSTNGWAATKVCPGQWNNVKVGSALVVNEAANQIYYINTNNQVCQIWFYDSGSQDNVLNSSAVRAISGSGLAIDQSTGNIYYVGSDSKIYIYTWTPSTGFTSTKVCPGQWNNARSDSRLMLYKNAMQIYYVNTSNQICALYPSGSSYGDGNIPGPTVLAGSGLSHNSQSGEPYYVGTDYKIYKLMWNVTWSYQSIHQSTVCQQPAINSDIIYYNDNEIYYVGKNDNTIHRFYYKYNALKNVLNENTENNTEELIGKKDLKVYPNPVRDNLTIEIPNNIQKPQINIFDITGKKAKSYLPVLDIENIDCSDLNSGIYILKLEGINYSKTIKIQVSK